MAHIALLVHGFAGKTAFMNEIHESLHEMFKNPIYDDILNLSYYSSIYGLDLSLPYDLRTPIYDSRTGQTLAHYLFKLIIKSIQHYSEFVVIDVYAHSMGGLVIRAMIKYLLNSQKDSFSIRRVFLLGTPNHGTRLAQKFINIPADIFLTGLNFILELPRGGISGSDWYTLNSQFLQMVPNSRFLRELNKSLNETEKSILWFTIRGLNTSGFLESVWQPFLFRKFWVNSTFPFIHRGVIPNDGLVDAQNVPLSHATNILIPEVGHMALLKWKSSIAGKKVYEAVYEILKAEMGMELL